MFEVVLNIKNIKTNGDNCHLWSEVINTADCSIYSEDSNI